MKNWYHHYGLVKANIRLFTFSGRDANKLNLLPDSGQLHKEKIFQTLDARATVKVVVTCELSIR